MRRKLVFIAVILLAAGTLASVVFAQLGDSRTATGSLNVSTTSADLYLCEPNNVVGPTCGSDDSLADEAVFETLEDLLPGDRAQWDLRLKNVGTRDWWVTGVTLNILETDDPISAATGDCPSGALRGEFFGGLTVLGKGLQVIPGTGDTGDTILYDEVNDNFQGPPPGVPRFRGKIYGELPIRVASGDYEDVRLRLQLDYVGTEYCDANQWEAAWQFTVN